MDPLVVTNQTKYQDYLGIYNLGTALHRLRLHLRFLYTVARRDKTLPRIQNTSQNPKPLGQNTYFGFWEVFCPYEPRFLYLCIIHYLVVYLPPLTHWVTLTAAN